MWVTMLLHFVLDCMSKVNIIPNKTLAIHWQCVCKCKDARIAIFTVATLTFFVALISLMATNSFIILINASM